MEVMPGIQEVIWVSFGFKFLEKNPYQTVTWCDKMNHSCQPQLFTCNYISTIYRLTVTQGDSKLIMTVQVSLATFLAVSSLSSLVLKVIHVFCTINKRHPQILIYNESLGVWEYECAISAHEMQARARNLWLSIF